MTINILLLMALVLSVIRGQRADLERRRLSRLIEDANEALQLDFRYAANLHTAKLVLEDLSAAAHEQETR